MLQNITALCGVGGSLLWVYDINHVFNPSANTQLEWNKKFPNTDMINGSFFKSNSKIIPPYATKDFRKLPSKKTKWWYVEYDNTIVIDSTYRIEQVGMTLKSPKDIPDTNTIFRIAVCPPLIVNSNDIDKQIIYKTCGKKFSLRNCRRTLIGRTSTGENFIFVGNGNLFKLRKLIRSKINNVEWLANLDGGSSSFLTVNNEMIIKNKTKIPSVLMFKTRSVEIIK